MTPIRVLSVIGTRPEAVKMAPVVKAMQADDGIESRVCVTAQHREMLDQVLTLFNIHPDHDLDLMRPDQSLAGLTSDILTNLDPILALEKPDWVLVQGDTTTVIASALAAFYRGIKVGHVEAGLRTGDKRQPFPEEINRRITGVMADLHFAPTENNRANLLKEGIPDWRVVVTGNTVIDALREISLSEPPVQVTAWMDEWEINTGKRRLILVTAHRRENFGKPIEQICDALRLIANGYGDTVRILYPVHLNPNIQEPVYRLLGNVPQVILTPPLDYLSLVQLMKNAAIVLTDSGGIQEEATGLGKPTLVLREKTERPEGVDAGVLKLVGANSQIIFSEASLLLDDKQVYMAMANAANPFGDGNAAHRIVQALKAYIER